MKGKTVKLLIQGISHLANRPKFVIESKVCRGEKAVKIGTIGKIIATRNDNKELLVKFDGHRTPRHTDANCVEFVD